MAVNHQNTWRWYLEDKVLITTWLQQAVPGMKAVIHMAACHGVTDGHVGAVLDMEVHWNLLPSSSSSPLEAASKCLSRLYSSRIVTSDSSCQPSSCLTGGMGSCLTLLHDNCLYNSNKILANWRTSVCKTYLDICYSTVTKFRALFFLNRIHS